MSTTVGNYDILQLAERIKKMDYEEFDDLRDQLDWLSEDELIRLYEELNK